MAGIDDFFGKAVEEIETLPDGQEEKPENKEENGFKPDTSKEKTEEERNLENKKIAEEEKQEENSTSILAMLAAELGEDLPEEFSSKEGHTADDLFEYVRTTRESHTANFLEQVELNYPDVYKILEVAIAGGNYKEVLSKQAPIKEITDNKDAINLLREYYKGKDLSDRIIDMTLEDLEAEDGLLEKANSIISVQLKEQEALAEQEIQKAKAQQAQRLQEDENFILRLKTKLASKDIGGFKLQNSELKPILDSALATAQRTNDGKYAISLKIDSEEDLTSALQAFIVFQKKGNLDSYLERKKTTLNINQIMKNSKGISSKKEGKVNNLDEFFK